MTDAANLPELRKIQDLYRPFALCGRRCYVIGSQNGFFPDIGWHTYNEMGGVWTHPIKIADGFWVGFDLPDEGREGYNPMRRAWLKECNEFVLGDGGAWVEHHYDNMKYQTNWDILPHLRVVRREFVPREEPALGIELDVTAKDDKLKDIQMNVLVRFDILPVWDSGWPDPIHLEAESEDGLVVVHGVTNFDLPFDVGRWSAALGSDVAPKRIAIGGDLWGPERTTGRGISVLMKYHLSLDPSARVRLVMAGDHTGEQGAIDTVNRVLSGYTAALKEKVDWYRTIAAQKTTVDTPEDLLNDGFRWGKMNLEWLTHTSPIVGTGTYAGLQDYTQYFGGDTEVSIPGLLYGGLHDTAISALRMLGEMAAKNGGRVPHAFVSNGHVYDPGQFGETPSLSRYVWDTYRWTGDEQFLKDMYPVCRQGLFEYVLHAAARDGVILQDYEDKPDSRLDKCCPTSIPAGFAACAKIAERLGDDETAAKCKAEAAKFLRQIEELFWVEEEGMYVGMLDADNKPMPSERALNLGEYDHGTSIYLAHGGQVEKARIVRSLERLKGPAYSGPYGVYLGVKAPDEPGGIMPYTSNTAAVGCFNYGLQELGLEFLRCTARTCHHIMPGAIPETVSGDGDPYKFNIYESSHWEFLQLWSAALYVEGLVWGLIRIEPDAARGKVTLTPNLPEGWPHAEINNITVGRSRFSVRLDKHGTNVTHVDGRELDITVEE